jgi:hypothetical protein
VSFAPSRITSLLASLQWQRLPLHLWDCLILVPQALFTLNLLHGSRLNPELSAWAQLNSYFDSTTLPLPCLASTFLYMTNPAAHSPHGHPIPLRWSSLWHFPKFSLWIYNEYI